jgi:uncharacterized protein YgbK (DUF1537 family)
MNPPLSKSETFASLPPPWPHDLRAEIAAMPKGKLIVLDDDPTGTQTVHDVPVLTVWDVETLRAEMQREGDCFYILTNSRSMTSEGAESLNREIARNIGMTASSPSQGTVASSPPVANSGEDAADPWDGGDAIVPCLISRSDSTLRGHFPLETDVLSSELGPFDATIIIPYFEAGGRYTIHDTHYVAEGDKLTPAAETPFAKDAVFGYSHSNLRDWVEEKTAGGVKAADVATISLDLIRNVGPDAVMQHLLSLPKGCVCIVNAAALADMDVVALAMLRAEQTGRRFLIRSAAQIVAARLGLETRPLLTRDDLQTDDAGGGLIVVGSYVPKTSEQLAHLLENSAITRIELSVPDLLDDAKRAELLESTSASLHAALSAKNDVVVFTSRHLITGSDAAQNLHIGQRVSTALVELVQRLTVRPRYLIAKGGITSSDVATKGLGLKRGIVAGQILPGVPVWRVGDETRFPGMPYIVFPGNVGGPDALTQTVGKMASSPSQGVAASSPPVSPSAARTPLSLAVAGTPPIREDAAKP